MKTGTIKKIFGIGILVSIFASMFTLHVNIYGFWTTLFVWAIAIAVACFIYVGVWLIHTNNKQDNNMERSEIKELLIKFIVWGGFDTGEPADDLAEEYIVEKLKLDEE